MDLSIVILNYKMKGLVKQCIKGIVAAQPQLDYEIVVVDNNSGDGVLEMVQALFIQTTSADTQSSLPIPKGLKIPSIRTIQAPSNGGFAVGNNLGMQQSHGKYVVVMNPDIAIVPDALEQMYKFMEQHQDVGIISPRLINPDGSVQYSCRRFPNLLTPLYRRTLFGNLVSAKKSIDHYLMRDFDHQHTVDVDWLFGACLVIRKSMLDQAGMFDERFFMYFEDLDLCRRFWEKGFRITYVTDVELVHYHQRLSAQRSGVLGIFTKGGRVHIVSGIKYFAKYRGITLPVQH